MQMAPGRTETSPKSGFLTETCHGFGMRTWKCKGWRYQSRGGMGCSEAQERMCALKGFSGDRDGAGDCSGLAQNTLLPAVSSVSCAQFEVIQSRLWGRWITLLAVSDLLPHSALFQGQELGSFTLKVLGPQRVYGVWLAKPTQPQCDSSINVHTHRGVDVHLGLLKSKK